MAKTERFPGRDFSQPQKKLFTHCIVHVAPYAMQLKFLSILITKWSIIGLFWSADL